ncbi:hypothetical protein K492DRAFT_188148 [Lichtheimia hyalospora FSU 10163]|nr:hypothetical protein K492DRAFT_188148 [Lichtheimia hyalospora FSU 10163]
MSTFRHHSLPPVTITLTDIVFATIDPKTTTTTTYSLDNTSNNAASSPSQPTRHQQHDRLIHQLLPVLGVFAIIGLLSILGLLVYLGYRFYRADRDPNTGMGGNRRRRTRNQDDDDTASGMPWMAAAAAADAANDEYDESDSDNNKRSHGLTRYVRKLHPPPTPTQGMYDDPSIISRTFVPMDTSPMTLVPRSEVLRDPARRRGIDALDLWEQKHQAGYPSSASSSETVQVSPRLDKHLKRAD